MTLSTTTLVIIKNITCIIMTLIIMTFSITIEKHDTKNNDSKLNSMQHTDTRY
jgi:hypothetical protein